jgi:hypothetical protein
MIARALEKTPTTMTHSGEHNSVTGTTRDNTYSIANVGARFRLSPLAIYPAFVGAAVVAVQVVQVIG